MIATDATHEHPATSLRRFFDAHREQYRQLLRVGDVGDYCPRSYRSHGSPKASEQTRINAQMAEAVERIRRGEELEALAEEYGVHPKTMRSRLFNRGLSVRKIRNQKTTTAK